MGSDDASDPAGDAQASPAMSMAQLAVAGGVSGLVARFATHPFDTLKTQMQVAGAVGGGDVPSSSRGGPASTSAASAPARYPGALETARALVRKEGPLGFYRGFGAVVAGIPFASAAYFGGYEAAKRATDATRERVASFSGDAWTSRAASALTGPTGSYVLSGIIAQSLASIAYTPIDVVKERMQAGGVLGARAAGRYDNFVAAYRAILKTEGIRGVFRGYWASNFTWWPFSVVYFVVYEHARDACAALARDARSPRDGAAEGGGGDGGGGDGSVPSPRASPSASETKANTDNDDATRTTRGSRSTRLDAAKDALPPWASGGCGFAAAAAATVATHPLDLAKTRLQTLRAGAGARASSSSSSSSSSSVFSIARDVARREGASRLFAGCGARVAAVAPGSAISFFAYEIIKEWMKASV